MQLAIIFGGVCLLFAGLYILTWIMRMQVVPPSEMMILSGAVPGGFRQIRGGRAFPLPVFHAKDILSCEAYPVVIKVRGALSKGEIPLAVDAYANVCIGSHPSLVKNAVRHILRKDRDEVLLLAQKTLEGNLREAISTLTPEEVIRDKEEFGRRITEASKDDLGKLGLMITSFVVQTISDDTRGGEAEVGYIGLLERTDKARAKAEALIATFSNKAESTEEAEKRRMEAELRRIENERTKFKRERDYQVNKANADGTVGVQKVLANQRAELARVHYQIKARQEEIHMTVKKLEGEVVKKAEADAKKMIEEASGLAAQYLGAGQAEVEVLQQTFEYIRKAGKTGAANYIVDRLPEIARALATTMRSAEAASITVMTGGQVENPSGHLPAPGRVVQFLEQVKAGSGVDLSGLLGQPKTDHAAHERVAVHEENEER